MTTDSAIGHVRPGLFDDAHRRAWIESASKGHACDRSEAIAKAQELVALLEQRDAGERR